MGIKISRNPSIDIAFTFRVFIITRDFRNFIFSSLLAHTRGLIPAELLSEFFENRRFVFPSASSLRGSAVNEFSPLRFTRTFVNRATELWNRKKIPSRKVWNIFRENDPASESVEIFPGIIKPFVCVCKYFLSQGWKERIIAGARRVSSVLNTGAINRETVGISIS